MSTSWASEIWRLILVLAPAWLLGQTVGLTGWVLALALGGYIAWHIWQLQRLLRWLRSGQHQVPIEASGIWSDIYNHVHRLHKTNRKRKKKLSAMLARFQESSAALPDATIVIGRDDQIEWFNDAAKRLLGLRSPQDIGRRITHLIRDPGFIQFLLAGNYSEPMELPSPVREDVHLSAYIVPYGNKQRLITVRDFTRIHRLEVMRRDFIANVSHELRTPLTVITGYLEGFDATAQDAQPMTGHMQDQADRMRRIIDDLLTLSRLETTDALTAGHEAVPVPSLLEDIEGEAALLIQDAAHTMHLEVDASLSLTGNAKELYSAFMNLVSNAIRYSPEGGDIHVQWLAEADGAILKVTDAGIGIEAMHLPRLTERFYRVDKNRSRTSGGTGLGLAIVKHILQRHDAFLRVESEPDRGSRFSCVFPARRVIHHRPTPLAVQA